MPKAQPMVERRGRRTKTTPLEAPDCCKMTITGCIEEIDAVITAIKPRIDVTQSLSVRANPSVTVNSDAKADANAAVSSDAAAVAPATPATPAASGNGDAQSDSHADPHSDALASTVTDAINTQTIRQEQDLVTIACKYRVIYHVCNARGCVAVKGEVRDANQNLVYNFQTGEASGKARFMTVSVLPTTQQFRRGVFTLTLAAVDSCNDMASFTDTSPEVIHV